MWDERTELGAPRIESTASAGASGMMLEDEAGSFVGSWPDEPC